MPARFRRRTLACLLVAAICGLALTKQRVVSAQGSNAVVAIVGATVIDGTGAAPIVNATIVMKDRRITAIGAKGSVAVPQGATVIDGTGKYVTPGFIDTNVHISMYANLETLARYLPRATEVVVEGAQLGQGQLRRAADAGEGPRHGRAR
jgi:imidazolonepropionase-like amidohydrolase